MNLILASTSIYRKRLLERLGLPFQCTAPATVENALNGEPPATMAGRLARNKAAAVAGREAQAIVIGSDQVASLHGKPLGKPRTHERARLQLSACSGQEVLFHTAVCMLGPGIELAHVEPFAVTFRHLNAPEIEDYLRRDQPYDCAGSFKWESLGIALFERLSGNDPTSLEGLPLITVSRMLATAGYPVLGRSAAAARSAGSSDR